MNFREAAYIMGMIHDDPYRVAPPGDLPGDEPAVDPMDREPDLSRDKAPVISLDLAQSLAPDDLSEACRLTDQLTNALRALNNAQADLQHFWRTKEREKAARFHTLENEHG